MSQQLTKPALPCAACTMAASSRGAAGQGPFPSRACSVCGSSAEGICARHRLRSVRLWNARPLDGGSTLTSRPGH
eukprot:2418290-Prymnesium_polylepis.1